MDRNLFQQLIVFAAIFLVFQVGFDLLQGLSVTPGLFLSRLMTTIVATALYGAVLWWWKKRKGRGR